MKLVEALDGTILNFDYIESIYIEEEDEEYVVYAYCPKSDNIHVLGSAVTHEEAEEKLKHFIKRL